MKLKKIFAVILACCIAFTCLVVPASASSSSVSSNTARYYAYLYELVLQYKNKEITLDTLLANAYNEYMNTGHDFTPSDMSYSDLLDYWLEKFEDLKARNVEKILYFVSPDINGKIK